MVTSKVMVSTNAPTQGPMPPAVQSIVPVTPAPADVTSTEMAPAFLMLKSPSSPSAASDCPTPRTVTRVLPAPVLRRVHRNRGKHARAAAQTRNTLPRSQPALTTCHACCSSISRRFPVTAAVCLATATCAEREWAHCGSFPYSTLARNRTNPRVPGGTELRSEKRMCV